MQRFLCLFVLFSLLVHANLLFAEPVSDVNARERCPVCGMFVAPYNTWITQIKNEKSGRSLFFDGVKDMMAYYFAPDAYGGGKDTFSEMWVKDYYSLEWTAARDAYYVIGSDVYGPMGHEFIPFSTLKAAEAFAKDHKGEKIVTFSDITSELVNSMRSGQRMR